MDAKLNDSYYEKLLFESMIIEDDSYCFDMNITDRIVKIKKKTKLGEQYYLFKKEGFEFLENSDNKLYVYYITDANAYVIGRVVINSDSMQDNLNVDCWLRKEYRGKGISEVVLETILNEIFVVKIFDDLNRVSLKNIGIAKMFISNLNQDGVVYNQITKKTKAIIDVNKEKRLLFK